MTTLKPQLIRADTLDLQNQDNPSAKDHTRQPTAPAPLGSGPAAPHQSQALRHAEKDALNEQATSPRVSQNPNDQGFYDDHEDGEYDGENGTMHDEDGEYGDQEGDEDDMMDKISSSPSIDDEDIDFEFVYALHTFVATVEGQANATKGDTMVLLDDSNSYWWLVRVVKDGSIGYLPAEHIETPTERLARLNKHRNIDLSATMLGDNAEKSKNPLKKAMRRRNAKQVQFSAPTYHEPPETEYSDEGEEEDGDESENPEEVAKIEDEGPATVEPLRLKTTQPSAAANGIKMVEPTDLSEDLEKERTSDEMFDRRDETQIRSRNGTVRNTDSFFKDEETKKISLTPRLLRGDSDNGEVEPANKPRGSLETFDKLSADEKEKKKKDKKSGVLSGLFKRKDKKGKLELEGVENEKLSEELSRASPQPKDQPDVAVQKEKSPQRQTSKLQKAPPSGMSPKISPTKDDSPKESPQLAQEGPKSSPTVAPLTVRPVAQQHQQPLEFVSTDTSALASSPIEPLVRPIQEDEDPTPPATQPSLVTSRQPDQPILERFGHAPTEIVSPLEESRTVAYPPGLIQDTSSSERRSESPISPTLSSVHSTTDHDNRSTDPTTASPQADAPHTPSTTRSTPSWSDASLRTYMDNDDDIRDLLIIVHDKSNVVPAGPEHPITGKLFGAEKDRLAEMQSNLDSMLTGLLARKGGSRLLT